jgi:hypothetical protein
MVQRTGRYGKADPTKPIGPHGLHNWWYRRLAAADIVRAQPRASGCTRPGTLPGSACSTPPGT